VRALEHAATADGAVRPGAGLATQRIGPATRLRVVDVLLSGTHEAGTSHYELLRAFTDDATLGRVSAELDACGYRTHEFGDSVLMERKADAAACGAGFFGREAARQSHLAGSGARPW
jgi:S-adenosylmethionine:tRNA ribosyltransferase-isomerase